MFGKGEGREDKKEGGVTQKYEKTSRGNGYVHLLGMMIIL